MARIVDTNSVSAASLPTPKRSVFTFGNPVYDRVNLAAVAGLALDLPGAHGLTWIKNMRVRRSRVQADVTAHAWDDRRITLTIGYDASVGNVVGTILHEVAHLACMVRGENWDDDSPQFAACCHALHDQWNERYGNIVRVCPRVTGAYVGEHSVQDYAAATIPVWRGSTQPKDPRRLRIERSRWDWHDYWAPLLVAGAALYDDRITVAVPGSIAREIESLYVDNFEPQSCSDAERERFCAAWRDAFVRRRGNGTQTILHMPARAIHSLRDAMETACDLASDEPLKQRRLQFQAAQVTDRLFTAMDVRVPQVLVA